MELRYLRYFLAVASTRSFTRAAAQCYVAQSALSEQIARLESEVGAQLFVRTSRSVRLTAAGEVLVPLAQRILADVETAQAELDALAGLRRGRLRLGLIQTSGGGLDLAAVLGDFHRRFGEIEFEVTSEPSAGMVAAVGAGTLDLAIVGLSPEDVPPGLERQLLSQDPLVAVVAPRHRLAGRARVEVAELAGPGAFIHFRRGSGIRRYVEAAFGRAGVAAPGGFEVSQVHDMIRLAAQGVGATIVPRSAATWLYPPGPGRDDFRVLRLADRAAVHPTSVIYDAARLSPAADAFLGVLREHAERAPAHRPG
ncbi:MAG TPA: LysR family transcriptional regulator [Streptosporangiaceae bacterium]